ncbi:MAG: hypothetical protein ACO3GP_08890 [Candidatus Limnocylindrus sp.]|jgi:hypothetical protein
MQYAPAVTDRSAEIYAQGANNATNIRAQGQANFQNSLTSSFNTAMGMVNSNIQKSEENRIASDGANAKFDMLKDYKKTDGQPLFTQETIDKFDTLPLGKRQAYVQTAEAIVDDDLKRWMYSQQYNAQNNRVNAQMLSMQPAPNQQPYTGVPATAPTAQPQANPAGGINMNFVK